MTWKALCHPNVLPLRGITTGDLLLAMVSEWMTNGNIVEFIKANKNVNRLELVGRCFGYWLCLPADNHHLVAQGRRQGVDVYPWSRNDTCGSERGTIPDAGHGPVF